MKTKLLCLALILCAIGLWALEIPLSGTPQISVSITGFVRNPGNYKVNPTDRLSDLLHKAQQELIISPQQVPERPEEEDLQQKLNPIPLLRSKDELLPEFEQLQGLRQVELKRNGQSTYYDLMKFYRLGDIGQNPILRDGDLVHIRVVEDLISVNGCVGHPGDMEYRAGDTLKDVLALAHNPLPGAELSAIRISRYQGSGQPYRFEIVNLDSNPDAINTPILPSDRIMVPYDALYRAKKTVTVSGEFKNHGEYLVDDDATVWDLIKLAGGLTEYADLSNAVMLSKSFFENPNGEFERLKLRSMAELTPLEYSYMRTIIRQAKGLYSIDFVKLVASEGKEANRGVNHQDYIYIPKKLNAVWVSGQVRRPGLIEYKEGQDYRYYINQAGGYASNSLYRGSRILRANSGNWVKVSKSQRVMPGDTVFVPDKIDRHFWTDVKDIVTVAASALTIIIGIQNLTR